MPFAAALSSHESPVPPLAIRLQHHARVAQSQGNHLLATDIREVVDHLEHARKGQLIVRELQQPYERRTQQAIDRLVEEILNGVSATDEAEVKKRLGINGRIVEGLQVLRGGLVVRIAGADYFNPEDSPTTIDYHGGRVHELKRVLAEIDRLLHIN